MSLPTRGLSWLSEDAAGLIRRFRRTTEALALMPLAPHTEHKRLELEHIAASEALCHYLHDLEEVRRQAHKAARREKQRLRR